MKNIIKKAALKIPAVKWRYEEMKRLRAENETLCIEMLQLRDVAEQQNSHPQQFENMMQCKKEVIDLCFEKHIIKSVAELGCVWGVNGVYGRYIAENHPATRVTMVDTHWTKEATELCGNYPNITIITENFGSAELPKKIGKVDAVILFDVLLHQVAPDWYRVLEMYALYTECFIICQPFYMPPASNAITVRLLDLGYDNYFQNTPHDKEHPTYRNLFEKMYEIHPDHGRIWRDVHHVWQWGITDSDLLHTMHELGFRLEYMKNEGRYFHLQNWENVAFIFRKKL